MSESSENLGLEDNRLGLFDVSLEDDCLYTTSSPATDFDFSADLLDTGSAVSLDLVDSRSLQSSVCRVNAGEHAPQPLESSEPEETKKNMKYNLRKSLAWDSAFFTSAGVLEPDELSSIIGQNEKRGMLPGIREELERSTDSLSTLASEGLTMENLEGDLFGDIRASIQKSSESSGVANSKAKSSIRTGSGKAATPAKQSPKKVEEASETKTKPKFASKKTEVVIPGSRRTQKHASPVTQAVQSLATKRDTASMSKPPKIAAKVSISTAAKRAPVSNTRVKLEKDKGKGSVSNSGNTKDLTGRLKIPISGGSQNNSKLSPPLRSSSSSTKTESVAKHSPNISPASSVSEWSLESISLSPTSTLNKRSNCSWSSTDTASCGDLYEDDESSQVSDSPSHSSEPSAARTHGGQSMRRISKENGGLRMESAKPSGLRPPSPKIGFFDGVRSSSRNSNGSSQTKPGAASSGLPRPGGVLHGKLGKPGNLQTAKAVATPVRSPMVGTQQQVSSSSKSKPPLSSNQEPSTAVPKVSGGSLLRNAKRSPSISPRVQSNTSSPGSSVEKNTKPVKVTPIDEQHAPIEVEKDTVEEKKVASIEYEQKASRERDGAKNRESSPSRKEMACFEQQSKEALANAPSVHEVHIGKETAEVTTGS